MRLSWPNVHDGWYSSAIPVEGVTNIAVDCTPTFVLLCLVHIADINDTIVILNSESDPKIEDMVISPREIKITQDAGLCQHQTDQLELSPSLYGANIKSSSSRWLSLFNVPA